MRYELRFTAYDMFDEIMYGVRVIDSHQRDTEGGGVILSFTGTVRGRGEEDPSKWLRGVLESSLVRLQEEAESTGLSAPPVGS